MWKKIKGIITIKNIISLLVWGGIIFLIVAPDFSKNEPKKNIISNNSSTIIQNKTIKNTQSKKGNIVISEPIPSSIDYVVNTNTRKFHKPSCSSVNRISDRNRMDYNGTREELIERGYVPCKRCYP